MRNFLVILSFLSALCYSSVALSSDKNFFHNIQGQWSGPGEIVAGKYKGTKFVCTLGGKNTQTKVGMEVDGTCRVGVFSQPMSAMIIKAGGGYVGKFLDGETGNGMDVTGGRYTKGRLVADIKRKDLNGIMVANLSNPNALKVTVSVNHNGNMVPVIGMHLQRTTDNVVTGSVD